MVQECDMIFFNIENYSLISNCHSNNRSGGISALMKLDIKYKLILQSNKIKEKHTISSVYINFTNLTIFLYIKTGPIFMINTFIGFSLFFNIIENFMVCSKEH